MSIQVTRDNHGKDDSTYIQLKAPIHAKSTKTIAN